MHPPDGPTGTGPASTGHATVHGTARGDRRVEVGDQVGVAAHRQQSIETVLRVAARSSSKRLAAAITVGTSPNSTSASPRHIRALRRSIRPRCRPDPPRAPPDRPAPTVRNEPRRRPPARPTASNPGGRVAITSAPTVRRSLNTPPARRCPVAEAPAHPTGRRSGVPPVRQLPVGARATEQRALATARNPDRLPVVAADLQGAEEAHLHEENLTRSERPGKRESSERTACSSTMNP